MSTFPPTFLGQIDAAVQKGLGAAASVLGQQFDVRRLSSSVNNSITSATPVATKFPAILRRTTSKKTFENATFDLIVFEATCDALDYLDGQDLLTESSGTPGYTGASYTFAQRRPPGKALLVRCESTITITRPKPVGGRASQQPTSGAIAAPGYLGIGKQGEQVLTLASGLYAFEDTAATPATVPCGLQPLNRIRDGTKNQGSGQLPTELYREHFIAYVPLLPGEQLNELDRLNFPNSDRYQVALLFTTENVGLSGYVCVVEKLAT